MARHDRGAPASAGCHATPRSTPTSEDTTARNAQASDQDAPLDEATGDLGAVAERLRALRAALLETIEALPETRLYRATDRAGWTIKHELSSLAAADEELEHVLERLRHAVGTGAEALHLRRFRGERMWAAQELRLGALRQHLEATGHRASAAVEAHAHALADAPLAIAGRELRTARDYLREHLEDARAGLERIRRAME